MKDSIKPVRRRRTSGVAVAWAAAALVAVLAVPTGSTAGLEPVQDTVDSVQGAVEEVSGDAANGVAQTGGGSGGVNTQSSATGSTGDVTPSAGTPPDYQPPLHGDNPHGQGTVATVDLSPEDTVPLTGDPGGGEDIVVGRSRGEQQDDGSYRGEIVIASVDLIGVEIGVATEEGESRSGPLDAVQTGLLDQLCDGSGDQICLEVLRADSSTTSDGSTNRFVVADAVIGGQDGITATAAESNGNISEDESCQTAYGDSTVFAASIGGELTADVLNSSSRSTACQDGSQNVEQSSDVINLAGSGVPLPNPGCADGTADSTGGLQVPGVLEFVCNADDTNGIGEPFGAQTSTPYGVREALTVFVLPALGTPLVKLTTAASESHAVAPAPIDDGGAAPDDGEDAPDAGVAGVGGGAALAAANGVGPAGVDEGALARADADRDRDLALTGSTTWILLLAGALALAGGMSLRRYAHSPAR